MRVFLRNVVFVHSSAYTDMGIIHWSVSPTTEYWRYADIRWPCLAVIVLHRSGVRPSVCPIFFNLNVKSARRILIVTRDGTRRGQRTFPCDYYKDGHQHKVKIALRQLLVDISITTFQTRTHQQMRCRMWTFYDYSAHVLQNTKKRTYFF